MQVWSSGGVEACCRRGDIAVGRHGALEARCRCSDGEERRYGGSLQV